MGLTGQSRLANSMIDSCRHVAQWESTALTRQGSRVQSPSCLPEH